MDKRYFLSLLGILLLLLLVAMTTSIRTAQSVSKEYTRLEQTKTVAERYTALKGRWEQKESLKRLLRQLDRIAQGDRREKGDRILIRYRSLTPSQMERIVQRLYVTTVKIEKLQILRGTDHGLVVAVEVVK